MNKVKIDTGAKSFEIEDLDGNVLGVFRFVPSDPGILNRYRECAEFFNNLQELIGDREPEEYLPDLEAKAAEKIDLLFGAPVAENFFKIASPFTMLEDGRVYAEAVIEVVGTIIEKEISVRQKKVDARMKKYTAKYLQNKKETPEKKPE